MKEDIEQLRQLIRDLNLDWLDEEFDEIFTAGKLQEKEFREQNRRTNKGIERIPFSDGEQLEIIINSIEKYFILLPNVQEDADKIFKSKLNISKTSFLKSDDIEFKKIDRESQKLGSLLKEI